MSRSNASRRPRAPRSRGNDIWHWSRSSIEQLEVPAPPIPRRCRRHFHRPLRCRVTITLPLRPYRRSSTTASSWAILIFRIRASITLELPWGLSPLMSEALVATLGRIGPPTWPARPSRVRWPMTFRTHPRAPRDLRRPAPRGCRVRRRPRLRHRPRGRATRAISSRVSQARRPEAYATNNHQVTGRG